MLASPSAIVHPSNGLLRCLRGATAIAPVLLALALSACASTRSEGPDLTVTGTVAPMTEADLATAAAFWGDAYAANPDDRAAALNYAAVLMRLDRVTQAVAVLQRAALNLPDDREIMAAYGKALATAGSFNEALTIIRRAQTRTSRTGSSSRRRPQSSIRSGRVPRHGKSTRKRSTSRPPRRRCGPISGCRSC